MVLAVNSPVLCLGQGEVMTLDDAAGARIATRSGVVWVTEEGVPHDFIVGPGEALRIAGAGRTVVQALEPAWISIR